MTTKHLNLPADLPRTYEELVRLYPPRKIHDQIELDAPDCGSTNVVIAEHRRPSS
jgi:hypothetical protein